MKDNRNIYIATGAGYAKNNFETKRATRGGNQMAYTQGLNALLIAAAFIMVGAMLFI